MNILMNYVVVKNQFNLINIIWKEDLFMLKIYKNLLIKVTYYKFNHKYYSL